MFVIEMNLKKEKLKKFNNNKQILQQTQYHEFKIVLKTTTHPNFFIQILYNSNAFQTTCKTNDR